MDPGPVLDRPELLASFEHMRSRSRAFFDALESRYEARPIPLRNPIVFYEGHLPAFAVNTLIKRGLGRRGIRDDFELLFRRGIDPDDERSLPGGVFSWPRREEVLAYAEEADALVRDAIRNAPLARDDVPTLRGGEALFAVLEHELMHQETLLYIARELPEEVRRRLGPPAPELSDASPGREMVPILAGEAMLGRARGTGFGWDNEFPETRVEVPAFLIGADDVTNGDFLEFIEADGYHRTELWSPEWWDFKERGNREHPHFWTRREGRYFWRGMAGDIPLPLGWPAWVTGAEACAYARWRGQRLPSEAELHRAAFGTPEGHERSYPWGEEPPDTTRGNFDFASFDPVPAGSRPAGKSAWGVNDLVGNGWEWTWTPFDGFPGFAPMPSYPEYSADFFDGRHRVMKGGSPATAAPLLRRSFRNWFRPTYPWVWASFRCVTSCA
jgi:ergothioneine biosynthesis protein EgtB